MSRIVFGHDTFVHAEASNIKYLRDTHLKNLEKAKKEYEEKQKELTNEFRRLYQLIADANFAARVNGVAGDVWMFVAIPEGHPLNGKTGNVSDLYKAEGCPFTGHWANISLGPIIQTHGTFIVLSIEIGGPSDYFDRSDWWPEAKCKEVFEWLTFQVERIGKGEYSVAVGESVTEEK